MERADESYFTTTREQVFAWLRTKRKGLIYGARLSGSYFFVYALTIFRGVRSQSFTPVGIWDFGEHRARFGGSNFYQAH